MHKETVPRWAGRLYENGRAVSSGGLLLGAHLGAQSRGKIVKHLVGNALVIAHREPDLVQRRTLRSDKRVLEPVACSIQIDDEKAKLAPFFVCQTPRPYCIASAHVQPP